MDVGLFCSQKYFGLFCCDFTCKYEARSQASERNNRELGFFWKWSKCDLKYLIEVHPLHPAGRSLASAMCGEISRFCFEASM